MFKIFKQKKGFELNNLYSFVLLLVLIGMLLGVGVLVLDNFSTSTGVTATASTTINQTRDALTPIASTWLPLIVTVECIRLLLLYSKRAVLY